MSRFSPEIERTLDRLADLCWDGLNGDAESLVEQSDGLLKALLMDGFARQSKRKLQLVIENRVLQRHRDKAIHRRAEIAARACQLQHDFDRMVRWEASLPPDSN